ncbi:hypothetical protein M9435_004666 [Picochlorum sp. BPE23]|nr:hypothetical protein M9435_004666 [Picochlorum sp. BPE23]
MLQGLHRGREQCFILDHIKQVAPVCSGNFVRKGQSWNKQDGSIPFAQPAIDQLLPVGAHASQNHSQDVLKTHPGQNIILSSEEFSRVSFDGLKTLYTALEDYDISVVLFWRNKADIAKSLYTELYYRNIPWKTFEEQLLDSIGGTMTQMPSQMCPNIQTVLDVFGDNSQNNVQLISFDGLMEMGQHPFDFLAETILDIPIQVPDDSTQAKDEGTKRRVLADRAVIHNKGVDLVTEALKNQIIKYYHITGKDVKTFCPQSVFQVAQEFRDEIKPPLRCHNLSRVFENLDENDLACVRAFNHAKSVAIKFHAFGENFDTLPLREGSGEFCLVSDASLKEHWHTWFAQVPLRRLTHCPPRKA